MIIYFPPSNSPGIFDLRVSADTLEDKKLKVFNLKIIDFYAA